MNNLTWKNRATWRIALAAAVGISVWLLLATLSIDQRFVAAIFSTTIALWALEAFPAGLTALLAPLVLVAQGALGIERYLRSLFDPVVLLMAACFILAMALERSGIANRLALNILSRRYSTRSYGSFLLTLGALCSGLSLLVSNTAVAAMMLPVVLTVIQRLGDALPARCRIGLLLMITWGASVAVGFLVGTPPNLIGVSYATEVGVHIGFLEWMIFGMPINIIMLAVAWLILMAIYGRGAPDMGSARELAVGERRKLGQLTAPEKWTLGVLVVVLIAWSLPDSFAALRGPTDPIAEILSQLLTPTNVALVGALLLLVAPNRFRTVTLRDSTRLDWSTLGLFGGGIALGHAAVQTGLTQTLGNYVLHSTGVDSLLGLTVVSTTMSVLLSELASNTASATVVVPLAVSLAGIVGVSAIPPILGASLGASFGFIMPISTPPNAIVYGSKMIPLKEMIKSGIIIDVIGSVVVVLALRVMLPLLGWW